MGIDQQIWLINQIRSFFVIIASVQILHAIFTYKYVKKDLMQAKFRLIQIFVMHVKQVSSPFCRDFERLNYEMLHDLINKDKSWDADSNVGWSQWIDTKIPNGIDNLKDSN